VCCHLGAVSAYMRHRFRAQRVKSPQNTMRCCRRQLSRGRNLVVEGEAQKRSQNTQFYDMSLRLCYEDIFMIKWRKLQEMKSVGRPSRAGRSRGDAGLCFQSLGLLRLISSAKTFTFYQHLFLSDTDLVCNMSVDYWMKSSWQVLVTFPSRIIGCEKGGVEAV
jgi:hypothetical protein